MRQKSAILAAITYKKTLINQGLNCLAGFLAAIFTDAIDLEIMACSVKVVFAPNFFFQLAYFRREKFNRRAALRADHVMVAAAVELVLIAGHAIWEWDSAGQAALRQQFESAVNGGETDLGIFFPDQAKQFISGKMITGLKKNTQDRVTLVRMFQPNTFQMFIKNLLRFTHRFA